MPQKLQVDRWLFSATVGLALFGVVMVYSASAVIAQQEGYSQFHYVIKQAVWTMIGFAAMFITMRFDHQRLNRRWIVYGSLLLTIALLCAVFAFPPVNGARRWIKFSVARHSRSEEHTSELQSRFDLVCRLLLEKKKKI